VLSFISWLTTIISALEKGIDKDHPPLEKVTKQRRSALIARFLQQRTQLFVAELVVRLEPCFLLFRQKREIDELALNRDHSAAIETHPDVPTKLPARLLFHYDDRRLGAAPEFALIVEAWLVRDCMAGFEYEGDADPRRALVDQPVTPDSVTRAMPKVHAVLPQMVPHNPVEIGPSRSGREDKGINSNVRL